jgi:hypothetical protein
MTKSSRPVGMIHDPGLGGGSIYRYRIFSVPHVTPSSAVGTEHS